MKIVISVLAFLLCTPLFPQVKSTNIQTVNGSSFYLHIVEKGQSLYSISKLYNVSLDEIYTSNPELKAGAKAGQEIKIPYKKENSASVKTTTNVVPSNTIVPVKQSTLSESTALPIDTNQYYTYKVAKKETFYSITKRFNITEAELKILNPSLISQGLKEGQVIAVGEKPVKIKAKHITVADTSELDVIHKPKKTSYNLSLILPFKLDQTIAVDLAPIVKNKGNFPVVPALAIDFYLGFKRAVDSLSSNDFEVNMDLYDVDDKDSLKLVQIVNDPKFKQNDLIFGPLHANGFKTISQKAKEVGIPIVSPLTQQNKMLYNNIYVSKTNPSQFTLLESLADYCIDSLMNNNAHIILMAASGKDAKEESYVKAFKKYYNERQKTLGRPIKDTVTVAKGLAGVKTSYLPNVKNVIIMLNTNQVFISDFTTQLAIFADKKDVVLCGWQSTSNIDNLDQEYLNQLHFTFPCQNNITNTAAYSSLSEGYKTLQNSYPSEYFFIGFDIAYFYLKNLKEAGPDFVLKLSDLNTETNYMRFKFTRPDKQTGFDNRGVYIFKYSDYQLQRTGWK